MPGFAPIYPDTRAPVLVGRDDELATALATMQDDATRLLTITGPAGVGKTRFGVELGRLLVDDYTDGAIVIDLTTIADPSELDGELARAAGLRNASSPGALDAWMRDHQVLLLFDNAEHVLGVGPRLAHWLAVSPSSRAIVTSRHHLNISIETELYLDPLDTAASTSNGSAPPASRPSPAARLFLQVVGVSEDERVDPATLVQVERICASLDGLPIALELVAARLPELAPAALDALMPAPDATTVPPGGTELDPALERAVDWSYRLLSEPARQILRYITVFVGGFSLELVERQVAEARLVDLGNSSVADCLDELSNHHLILPVEHTRIDAPRFRMLALVTEAARHWLIEHEEETDAREAHARAIITYAEHRQHSGLRPRLEYQVVELVENVHNIAAALSWFDERDDGAALVRLNGALAWFWYAHGRYSEGQAWYERTLRHDVPRSGRPWARFLLGYGILLDIQGHFNEAHQALTEALAGYTADDYPSGIATTSVALGFCSFHLERYREADEHLQRAVEEAQRITPPDLGQTLEGLAWENLGANAHEQGALAEAEDAVRHAVAIQQRAGFRWGESRALCDLGGILRDRHDLHGAIQAYKVAIPIARQLGDHRLIAASLAGIATVLAMDSQPMQVAWLWGAIDALHPMAGTPSYVKANLNAYTRGQRMAREQSGAEVYDATYRIGARASMDEVMVLANEVSLHGGPLLNVPPVIERRLTFREREVLVLLVRGGSTRSISAVLGITERTVSSHIGSLFRKLGVGSRLELIAMIIQAQ